MDSKTKWRLISEDGVISENGVTPVLFSEILCHIGKIEKMPTFLIKNKHYVNILRFKILLFSPEIDKMKENPNKEEKNRVVQFA